jgi:hypothetical protein
VGFDDPILSQEYGNKGYWEPLTFIRSVFERRLPASVTYDLVFSYRGDCSLFLANNDGTVELSSELDQRAQREARRIYGYDEDHGSILTSAEAIDQLARLLAPPTGSPQ